MQTCNNCHQDFEGKYCNHCGQKASVGRLSLHEVFHELVHSFTHAEKGILRLTKDLLFSPRKVYLGYFRGKRKTYFSPVMFFLLAIGFVVVLGDKLWQWEDYITHRGDEFGRAIHKYEKLRFLIAIPFISLISWLFFYKRYNLAECLTFWFFCMGLISIIGLISYLPQFIFIRQRNTIRYFSDWIAWVVILIHIFLIFFNRTWWSGIKCFVLAVIAYVLLVYIYLLLAYENGIPVNLNFENVMKSIISGL